MAKTKDDDVRKRPDEEGEEEGALSEDALEEVDEDEEDDPLMAGDEDGNEKWE